MAFDAAIDRIVRNGKMKRACIAIRNLNLCVGIFPGAENHVLAFEKKLKRSMVP
jgi:hypothetical protein